MLRSNKSLKMRLAGGSQRLEEISYSVFPKLARTLQ